MPLGFLIFPGCLFLLQKFHWSGSFWPETSAKVEELPPEPPATNWREADMKQNANGGGGGQSERFKVGTSLAGSQQGMSWNDPEKHPMVSFKGISFRFKPNTRTRQRVRFCFLGALLHLHGDSAGLAGMDLPPDVPDGEGGQGFLLRGREV